MIFKVTMFNVFEDQICDIDYKTDLQIDLSSFEFPEISGFEFSLPFNVVPNSFNSDEIQLEILTEKIDRATTTINVTDGSLVSVNDYLWLGNEVIKVTNIATNDLTIERGQKGTIANNYQRKDELGVKLYLYKYPVWFSGKLVKIESENFNIIQYGIIDKEPSYKKGQVTFSCSDVSKSLDCKLPTFFDNKEKMVERVYLNTFLSWSKHHLSTWHDSYDAIPEFFAFTNFVLPTSDLFNYNTNFDVTKIGSFKELFEILLKASKSTVYLGNDGKYSLRQITPSLSFETDTEIKMLDYMNISNGYSISKFENVKTISFSYNDNKEKEKKININITNILFGKQLDIDLSAFYHITITSIYSLLTRYFYDTSFVYAVVEVESTKMLSNDLIIGKVYKYTDVLNYSFQDVSDYCMYLGFDNDTMRFAILKNFSKTLISPAIPVKLVDAGPVCHFGWIGDRYSDFDLIDFLNVSEYSLTVEDAEFQLNDISIKYFEVGDKVKVFDLNNSIEVTTEITAIDENEITCADNIGGTGKYWLYYDILANANAKQLKFFYFTVDSY
jgi:hypothetical protein